MYELKISEPFYIKDPRTTDLGKRITTTASTLLCEQGYTNFTLKKLAVEISSVEASIYRYFESKEHLLFYLLSNYWSLVEVRLNFAKLSSNTAIEKLHKSIDVLLGQDDIELHGLSSDLDFEVLQTIARKNYYFGMSLLKDDDRGKSMQLLFVEHMYRVRTELAQQIEDLVPNMKNAVLFADTILNESLYSEEELKLAGLPEGKEGYLGLAGYLKELISRMK